MKGVGKSVLLVCKSAQEGLEMHFMAEEKLKKTFWFFGLFIFERHRIYNS